MPFYRCLIPKDSLTYEQREQIAVVFTDVHCGLSDAPRRFVQVAFIESDGSGEVPDSNGQGVMRYETPYFIAGGNRAGRSEDTKRLILSGLVARLSEIAGVPADMISGHITEAPAAWTMEARRILPEPGEEAAWLKEPAAVD